MKKGRIKKYTQQDISRFIKFTIVGFIGTSSHFAVLTGLVELGEVDIVVASSFGFLTGFVVNYFLNYKFTFKSNSSHAPTLFRYIIISSFGLLLNMVILKLMCEKFGLYYLLGQVMASGVVLVSNFSLSTLWVFRRKQNEPL